MCIKLQTDWYIMKEKKLLMWIIFLIHQDKNNIINNKINKHHHLLPEIRDRSKTIQNPLKLKITAAYLQGQYKIKEILKDQAMNKVLNK